MTEAGVEMLGEKHLIHILLFLKENGRCNKTAIYRNISSNPRIPDKLNLLEESGLLEQRKEEGVQTVWISLTPKGEMVSTYLLNINDVL
jgi:predicted transcriptional regulator